MFAQFYADAFMVDDDWLYFVDDDWLHFVGFIIYGFVSTSAHFDSIWFNPIQSNSVSFCFQFRVVLNFISDLFLFVSLGYFVEVMELVELVMVLGLHDDWWMVEGWRVVVLGFVWFGRLNLANDHGCSLIVCEYVQEWVSCSHSVSDRVRAHRQHMICSL